MYKFTMTGVDSQTALFYDEAAHVLFTADGKPVTSARPEPAGLQFQKETVFRVSFGKRCNFSCKYCIQPKVFVDQEVSPTLVDEMFRVAGDRGIRHITMWGGEPSLYIEQMRLFTSLVHAKSPNTKISTLSNGTILTDENTQWLMDNNIYLTISWDGPGQYLRGYDVFERPEFKRNFIKLYEATPHNISVNPVITRANFDFMAYVQKLKETLGFLPTVGEAGALIVVDDSSLDCVVKDENINDFSVSAYKAFTAYGGLFAGASEQACMWLHRLTTNAFDGPTRCCCTSPNTFAIDLDGNIMVCQSFSKDEVDEFNHPYCLGNLRDIPDGGPAPYYLPQAFLDYKNEHCKTCFVRKACRANCPYTATKYRDSNCKLLKSYYTAITAYALYMLTGDTLTHVEAMYE